MRCRFLIILGMCLFLIVFISYGQAGTITLHAIHDTYANVQSPDTPCGNEAGMVSGISEYLNPLWITYLKFNLSSIGNAKVTSATLYLYQVDGYAPWATAGTNVVRLEDVSWNEAALTWNNQPNFWGTSAPFASSSDDGLHRGWTAWTWTPSDGDPNLNPWSGDLLTLRIFETMGTTQAHVWLSDEYSTYPDVLEQYGPGLEPYFVITIAEQTPEPASLVLLASGLLAALGCRRLLPRR